MLQPGFNARFQHPFSTPGFNANQTPMERLPRSPLPSLVPCVPGAMPGATRPSCGCETAHTPARANARRATCLSLALAKSLVRHREGEDFSLGAPLAPRRESSVCPHNRLDVHHARLNASRHLFERPPRLFEGKAYPPLPPKDRRTPIRAIGAVGSQGEIGQGFGGGGGSRLGLEFGVQAIPTPLPPLFGVWVWGLVLMVGFED